jgi:phosphoglycolate phosphatase-like HAD superfamily hydrolase
MISIQIPNLDAVFFDFDGVLVDSVKIKEEAYQEIFFPYGKEAVDQITLYHRDNGGIDRYKKIQHVLNLNGLDPNLVSPLAEEFATKVVDKVIQAKAIEQVLQFLIQCSKNDLKTFLVSGTPEEELKKIVSQKGWKHLFLEIHGSPRGKVQIVQEILNQYQLPPRNCLFIGDAITDYKTALELNLWYFGVPEGVV